MMYLYEFKKEHIHFKNIIRLFLVLVVINVLFRLSGVFVPFALLFGPLQYFSHQLSKGDRANSSWLYHFIPFLGVSLLFGTFGAPLYLAVLTLSSIGYSVCLWTDNAAAKFRPAERLIMLQIAAVSAIGSVFIAVLFFSTIGVFEVADIGFNASYVLYGLLLVCSTILFAYLLGNKQAGLEEGSQPARDHGERLGTAATRWDASVLESYASQIETIMEEKKLFLNAALSMDELQLETGIPKHHLSRVFTVRIGKTFYQYIAEKRIEEAKRRMHQNSNLTIEFLAFECGFNSKTTFNKYFKQISSVTPSEYRSSLSEN